MKNAIIIIRTLFGLLLVFSAVVVLFKVPVDAPAPTGNALTFMTGLMATGYFMTLLKVVELICGMMLIANICAPLATVAIFPISLNIILFHAFLDDPKKLPVAVFVILANLFLAYAYRKNYVGLLATKPLS